MYKSVIEIKENTPVEILKYIRETADKAFDNRAGKAINTGEHEYQLIYAGDDNLFNCLDLGTISLKRNHKFLEHIKAWNWIDEEDSNENCDILKLFTKKKRHHK